MKCTFCLLVVLVSFVSVRTETIETGHNKYDWSQCLGKCGKGIQVRTRSCTLGTPCDEKAVDFRFCQHEAVCADVEVRDEDEGDVDTSCIAEFRKIGCFQTNHTHMHLIKKRTWELPATDAVLSMWKRYKLTLEKFACECSKAARKGGYYYFSIGHAGYCWAGEVLHEMKVKLKKKNMVSNQCFMDTAQPNAVHNWHHEYFFFVVKDVDGGYSTWGRWSPCTAKCGTGYRWRERQCTNPYPKGRGMDCDRFGDPAEIASCKVKECPVNGDFTKFTPYGKCTKTCGGGVQTRTRTCTNPKPAYGGNTCVGKLSETRPCNTLHCPVNGDFTKFTPYGKCTKACGGGVQTRTRTCTNPTPAYGGNTCVGKLSETRPCNTLHCPVNGDFTKFTPYGKCTKTCGGGVQTRTRTCTNPTPAYGGNTCVGKLSETRPCNTLHCPVNGGLTKFAPFGKCSKLCGWGIRTRTRTCTNPKPAYGGKTCVGKLSQAKPCNTYHCPDIHKCKTRYTTWHWDGKGDMTYLSKHKMKCAAGKVMKSFRLEKSADMIRYAYTCCVLHVKPGQCVTKELTSNYAFDGRGDTLFLNRHYAFCGSFGFLSSYGVETENTDEQVRYRYNCCELKPEKWRKRMQCYYANTEYTTDGQGENYHLTKQKVTCRKGYALSFFKLHRNFEYDSYRYRYKCCRVDYRK